MKVELEDLVSSNHNGCRSLSLCGGRYRLWFLWTEFKLKLAMSEMDLEGLWKHTLQHLLLSVMFCFGAGCNRHGFDNLLFAQFHSFPSALECNF